MGHIWNRNMWNKWSWGNTFFALSALLDEREEWYHFGAVSLLLLKSTRILILMYTAFPLNAQRYFSSEEYIRCFKDYLFHNIYWHYVRNVFGFQFYWWSTIKFDWKHKKNSSNHLQLWNFQTTWFFKNVSKRISNLHIIKATNKTLPFWGILSHLFLMYSMWLCGRENRIEKFQSHIS